MRTRTVIALCAVAVLIAACETTPEPPLRATAQLKPTKGSKVFGEVSFEQEGDKVRMQVVVQGLKPGGEYGFHIHEVGDCSAHDAMSTKGHFNPFGKPHGYWGDAERHAGDLPSILVPHGDKKRPNKAGRAQMNVLLDQITLKPGPGNIVGRGIIVHAQPDDYTTQPTGNAGARIACGVIQAQ
jgi:Cu-Zn family superoxide dismutase